MIALLLLVLVALASPFKSTGQVAAENMALRHQVMVLRRQARGRVRLTNADRLILVQLYRWFPSILKVLSIVQPETSFVGIGPAFAGTGVGNPVRGEGGRPLRLIYVR